MSISKLCLPPHGPAEPECAHARIGYKLTLEGKRATGIEIAFDGKIQRITAGLEVVLSGGAMHTPKVLMLSGIGRSG
jgi:choline dehydrogenase-like flavoprotein